MDIVHWTLLILGVLMALLLLGLLVDWYEERNDPDYGRRKAAFQLAQRHFEHQLKAADTKRNVRTQVRAARRDLDRNLAPKSRVRPNSGNRR